MQNSSMPVTLFELTRDWGTFADTVDAGVLPSGPLFFCGVLNKLIKVIISRFNIVKKNCLILANIKKPVV